MIGAETRFLLDIVLLFAIAGICSIVLVRLKFPAIFGYLAAGIVLGPTMLPDLWVEQATINMLSSFGIIEIKHGDGMYVVDHSAECIFGFMGYEPDPDNISHMLGLRKVVEIGSIKIAAGRFTQEQYDYLAPLVEQIGSEENPEKVEEADRLFHEKIVSYTDNPLIIVIYKMMTKMLRIVFHDLMYHEDVKENAYKAHMEVLRALQRRDVEGSARALDNHLSQVNHYAHKYALIYKDV
jgi:DNA-binding FadR family transcriptional regulator